MQLTENNIKQIMLRYLKTHYKYRIGGDGKAEFKLDQRGEGGIIADGFIRFQLDENTPFFATFEATASESRHEVAFRPRTKVLLWDCFSFGQLMMTIIFGILYFGSYVAIKSHGFWWIQGFLATGVISFGVLFFFIFRNHRRYRYIYAVEQFKQYFADDQWIAIGADVFEHPEGDEMEELKRQCALNGFGLVAIDQSESPQLLISPARQDEFQNKRRQLLFIDQRDSIGRRTFRTAKSFWDKVWSIFNRNSNAWKTLRFQSASYLRVSLMALGASLLGYLLWQQLMDTEYDYLNPQEWQQEVSKVDGSKEGSYYMAGKENLRPFDENATSYLDLLPEDEANPVDPALTDIEIFMASDSRLFTYYDCTRLYNFDERKFMIKWRTFSEFETAKSHVIRLMQKGIRCNVIWHGCFQGDEEGYIVFLDVVYRSRANAVRKGNFLQAWLGNEGEEVEDMSILVIRH